MSALAHAVLHIALCNAISRAPSTATIAMRVQLAFPSGDPPFDKVFKFQRGDGDETTVEFDIPRGMYRLALVVAKPQCSAIDYVDFLPEHNRVIKETLVDGPPQNRAMIELQGTTPFSFTYSKPTFVLLDPSVKCNGPVGDPLPGNIVTENERDAYYSAIYYDPDMVAKKPTLALRLRTNTGIEHYIRLRIPFMYEWGGFAGDAQLNVTEDMLDDVATEKPDVLLCPPMWQSRVSGGVIPRAGAQPTAAPAQSVPAQTAPAKPAAAPQPQPTPAAPASAAPAPAASGAPPAPAAT